MYLDKDTLRSLREKNGFSQGDLARKSDTSQSYISLLEKGERPTPSFSIISRLAKALNCSPDDIFKEFDEKKPTGIANV